MSVIRTAQDAEQTALATILNDVQAAAASRAVKMGGSSFETAARSPEEAEGDLNKWYPDLSQSLKKFSSPMLTASLATQVGPLNTGSITFDGGVPVGGWAQLTLFQSGTINFLGHFHDSGAPSYNVAFAVGVRSQRGVLYLFSRTGHMAGTFESGSRNFDWNIQENHAVIREDWANIAVGSTWWWSAQANWDVAAAIDAVKRLAQGVGQIVSVIALVA